MKSNVLYKIVLELKEGAEEEIEEMLGGVESKIADAIINARGEK